MVDLIPFFDRSAASAYHGAGYCDIYIGHYVSGDNLYENDEFDVEYIGHYVSGDNLYRNFLYESFLFPPQCVHFPLH